MQLTDTFHNLRFKISYQRNFEQGYKVHVLKQS